MLGIHGLTKNPVVGIESLAVGDGEVRDQQAVVFDLDHITRGEWHVDGLLVLSMSTVVQPDQKLGSVG